MDRRLFLCSGILMGSPLFAQETQFRLSAQNYVVVNALTGVLLAQRNATQVHSIASITKLMTAMVVLDLASNYKNRNIRIENEDVDTLKGSSSRLSVGSVFPASRLLHITLMSSDNRAAHALARTYPGGRSAFVTAMNSKARQLGLLSTTFVDSSGLSPGNKSTAKDVAWMTSHAGQYADIRFYSTQTSLSLTKNLVFRNTNAIVRNGYWPVVWVSKTGFTRDAGRCVTMLAQVEQKPVVITLLGAPSSESRTKDLDTTYKWLRLQQGFRAGV